MLNLREQRRTLPDCPDCNARPGQYHRQPGCEIERCPRCGWQLLWCLEDGCPESEPGEPWPPPLDDREVWTGEWPGDKDCEDLLAPSPT